MSKLKVTTTAQDAATRWRDGMTSSIPKIQAGVNALTVNPLEQAAAHPEKWLAGIQKAHANGTYAAGLRGVSFADWKNRTISKVGERMSGGVTAATPNYTNAMTGVFNHINAKLPEIAAMPSNNLQDSLNRMTAFITHMAGYKK